MLNYVAVTGLTKGAQGFVDGVIARDVESGAEMRSVARAVIKTAGAWADVIFFSPNPRSYFLKTFRSKLSAIA